MDTVRAAESPAGAAVDKDIVGSVDWVPLESAGSDTFGDYR